MENQERFKEVKLTSVDRSRWIQFHDAAYKEDQKMSEELLIKSPRWSVITAYYAMHDISKLYLAKIHDIKVVGKDVHEQTIHFISKYMEKEREKVVQLLEDAKKKFDAITRSSVGIIPSLLRMGKKERGKTQYYDEKKASQTTGQQLQAATYFKDNFMKPYIEIMEKML